ncbi:hypothetical protein [Campylobacter upsaliensis]|uniref:hypothetical protein n=1 Tax=Campylobacter upsaliensis TaxID=28080 RepID=UPI002149E66D|nr:hypothetical protein [Campylobacter upsaliensis]MCR2097739.1 hypothetical protein [Campylobacter upsaliensis]
MKREFIKRVAAGQGQARRGQTRLKRRGQTRLKRHGKFTPSDKANLSQMARQIQGKKPSQI